MNILEKHFGTIIICITALGLAYITGNTFLPTLVLAGYGIYKILISLIGRIKN